MKKLQKRLLNHLKLFLQRIFKLKNPCNLMKNKINFKKYLTKKVLIITLLPFFVTLSIIIIFMMLFNSSTNEMIELLEIEVSSNINSNVKSDLLVKDSGTWEEISNQEWNFNEISIIILSLGKRPTGGYSIDIEEIIETKDSIKITAFENYPGKECIVTQAISYPKKEIAIPKTNKEKIEVNYKKREISC